MVRPCPAWEFRGFCSQAQSHSVARPRKQRPVIKVWSPLPCCCRAFSPPTLSRPDQIFVPNLAVHVNLKYRAQLTDFVTNRT
jgi:hypothetical protein